MPDQSSDAILAAMRAHLQRNLDALGTANELTITARQVSDYWLADTSNTVWGLAAEAIHDVWGTEPLLVREGGSYGGISSFLERTLGAPVVHLPIGSASDNAHLPNERSTAAQHTQRQERTSAPACQDVNSERRCTKSGAGKRAGRASPSREEARPSREEARPSRDEARPSRDEASRRRDVVSRSPRLLSLLFRFVLAQRFCFLRSTCWSQTRRPCRSTRLTTMLPRTIATLKALKALVGQASIGSSHNMSTPHDRSAP